MTKLIQFLTMILNSSADAPTSQNTGRGEEICGDIYPAQLISGRVR